MYNNAANMMGCLMLPAWLLGCGHGLPVPSYDEVILRHQSLELGYGDIARRINYGQSVAGRTLTAFRIAKAPLSDNAKSVLIVGTIHGNEYMNIVDRLGGWFLSQTHTAWFRDFLDAGHRIYLVPIANPDGFENWRTHRFRPRRRNSNRVDLNRDFDVISIGEKRLTQPETRYLIELLEQERAAVRLMISYHCCAGALGYPGGYYPLSLPPVDKQRHIETARGLHEILWGDIKIGDWKSILDYTGKGNATDYFYERYQALSFLYEGNFNEHDLFTHHTRAWRYLLTNVMQN